MDIDVDGLTQKIELKFDDTLDRIDSSTSDDVPKIFRASFWAFVRLPSHHEILGRIVFVGKDVVPIPRKHPQSEAENVLAVFEVGHTHALCFL